MSRVIDVEGGEDPSVFRVCGSLRSGRPRVDPRSPEKDQGLVCRISGSSRGTRR